MLEGTCLSQAGTRQKVHVKHARPQQGRVTRAVARCPRDGYSVPFAEQVSTTCITEPPLFSFRSDSHIAVASL